MKPCGHDHDELNHVGSTSTVGVVMPFANCVVAVPDITLSWGGEATDLAVAQPVVDEREETPRRSTRPMLRPRRAPTRAFTEEIIRVADRTGDGLHGGPAQQAGSLLGDVAAWDVGVGLAAAWGEPGPPAQSGPALWNRWTSPISATNTAPRTGPTPRSAWIAS